MNIIGFLGTTLILFTSPAQSQPSDNMFTLELQAYHTQCSILDGGDFMCQPGDPCKSDPTVWERLCDNNRDNSRDFQISLTSLDQWKNLYWEPENATKALAAEHYPQTMAGKNYTRIPVPTCEDGTNTAKGETTCTDGQPVLQCTDGTRPLFYFHQGTTDRWIVHIQTGSSTCSSVSPARNCWKLSEDDGRSSLNHFSSAWGGNDDTRNFSGLFDPAHPLFGEYNHVYLDKCVGDRNRGANTLQDYEFLEPDGTPINRGTVYFHGFRIIKGVLAFINNWDKNKKVSNAIQVSIDAQSNGSNGLYMYLDRVTDFIHGAGSYKTTGLNLPQLDVRGLASSFVRSNVEVENLINNPWRSIFSWNKYEHKKFDDHITAPASEANGLWYSTLSSFDGIEFQRSLDWGNITVKDVSNPTIDDLISVETLDASCFDKHTLPQDRHKNPEACLDSMHVLLNHLTTPVFVSAQSIDPNISQTQLMDGWNITDSFEARGYEADLGSVCGSHDENFRCTEVGPDCPADLVCKRDSDSQLQAVYAEDDFIQRVQLTTEGFTGQVQGRRAEESPKRASAPVGHGAFITQLAHHLGWSSEEKMEDTICDDNGANNCFWESPKMEQALHAWLEQDAKVICVEDDEGGEDGNRPLTTWSETTPGPVFDDRCGRVNP